MKGYVGVSQFKRGTWFYDPATDLYYVLREYDERNQFYICSVYQDDDTEDGLTQIGVDKKTVNDIMKMELNQY